MVQNIVRNQQSRASLTPMLTVQHGEAILTTAPTARVAACRVYDGQTQEWSNGARGLSHALPAASLTNR